MIMRLLAGLSLLLCIVLLGLFGGAGSPFDGTVVRSFALWRSGNPGGTAAAVLLTHLGGAPFLLAATAVAAVWLLVRHERGRALALTATVLGGRLLIELLKLATDRPRPAVDAHPVTVFSQSFPSGHAGNSAITFGALALFALPERWRVSGLAAAVLLSGAIGATRPILGVHWPTDVLGGWCLGALWLLLCWTWWRSIDAREQQHPVVGRH